MLGTQALGALALGQGPSAVAAGVAAGIPPEVMWPIASRPKWRRRGEAQDDQDIAPPAEAPQEEPKRRKWAKGTLRDALTEAGARAPEPLPQAPALQDPGRPSMTMAQMLAAQAALDEQARLRAEALRLEAIRRDDEEVIALFLSRY